MTLPKPTRHRSGRTRQEIFSFVRDRIAAGAPPTVREVQRAFGFKAVQSAQQHLVALVAEGRLVQEVGTARGYRLPANGTIGVSEVGPTGLVSPETVAFSGGAGPVRYIPRLGRVQAGALQEAIEDPDGWVPVAGGNLDDELFALTVRGESMVGAGILPGDTVVVRRQETARDGEIVVASVEGEATVKRLKLRAGRIELQPENPSFAPIEIAPDTEIRILGRVVEVRRQLV
jgi:repressor LexA